MSSIPTFHESMIVLQPSTYCNLKCRYCYLATTDLRRKMRPEIAHKVAEYIRGTGKAYDVAFHGGEPLTTGLNHFRALAEIFVAPDLRSRVHLSVQTNATLIDDRWCRLFEEFAFSVGVSLDGDSVLNRRRVYRDGTASFDAVCRGLSCLHRHNIPFGVIAVVGTDNLGEAATIYSTVKQLGARTLAINIEEQDGTNKAGVRPTPEVDQFWKDLYRTWREDRSIAIREFDKAFELLATSLASGSEHTTFPVNILPSVSVDGDVCLLSPELMNGTTKTLHDFIIGNVLVTPLHKLIEDGRTANYVQDHMSGVDKCIKECEYYELCGGGFASNKFFENGTTNSTLTDSCRNSTIKLYDAILDSL